MGCHFGTHEKIAVGIHPLFGLDTFEPSNKPLDPQLKSRQSKHQWVGIPVQLVFNPYIYIIRQIVSGQNLTLRKSNPEILMGHGPWRMVTLRSCHRVKITRFFIGTSQKRTMIHHKFQGKLLYKLPEGKWRITTLWSHMIPSFSYNTATDIDMHIYIYEIW